MRLAESGAVGAQAESIHQPHGVIRGSHLGVIVAIDIDVATLLRPGLDLGCPLIELAITVAARVKLIMTMESHVHHVSSDLGDDRPLTWIIGNHQRDLVPTKQLIKLTVTEAFVPDFDDMAQPLVRVRSLGQRLIIRHALIMSGGNLGG